MYSIKELFKIGNGPSSSHTMGPKNATLIFNDRYKDMDFCKVILYGSLALTGKGHLTDYIIDKTLIVKHEIVFDYNTVQPHPNTIEFYAYKNNDVVGKMKVFSIGGGSIKIDGEKESFSKNIYSFNSLTEIKKYCIEKNISFAEYVYSQEDSDFKDFLDSIYLTMMNTINIGLKKSGVIKGKLKLLRKARKLYFKRINESEDEYMIRHLYAYAYAVSEENADGGIIVTAPTCGSCGVLPAVIRFSKEKDNVAYEKIIDGLAVAGLIGNLVKTNASISGAEAGCQAEIGAACAMAAAYYAYVKGLTINQIEQSSEIALEHHLGLTCDPVMGYVQIPCIERNAVGAIRAVNSVNLANLLDTNDSKVSFDTICKTMLETGKDLMSNYRETSKGGLAKSYNGD